MLVLLRRQWKLFPVTSAVVVTATALFAATRTVWAISWAPWAAGKTLHFVRENLGWYPELRTVARALARIDGRQVEPIMEQFGAIGLRRFWDGEAWRLLVAGFHHGFFLHLAGNVVVLAYLGRFMESRMRPLAFLGFCLASSVFSVLAEVLAGNPAVGLSGAGYAMFGYLIVARLRDEELASQLPRSMVIAGLVSVLACLPISWLGLLPIANIAHFTGLGYGLLAGTLVLVPEHRVARAAFLASHLLLWPMTALAMKPTWTDTYLIHRALATDDPVESIRWLSEMLERHPERTDVRHDLAVDYVRAGQRDKAWRLAVEGWGGGVGRSQQLLVRLLRSLWQMMPDDEARVRAEVVMDEVLGDESEFAKSRLDLAWYSVVAQQERARIRQMMTQAATQDQTAADLPDVTVDPDRPGSAARGERL